MTTQDQLILVCEKLLGWKLLEVEEVQMCYPGGMQPCKVKRWFSLAQQNPFLIGGQKDLPPLTLDLMWECEEKLSAEEFTDKLGFIWSQRCEYMSQLERIVIRDSGKIKCNFEFYHATAEQRLAALVETIGGGRSEPYIPIPKNSMFNTPEPKIVNPKAKR